MCMSCGCEEYEEKHDKAAIDWADLAAAAHDAGIDPETAAENIMQGTLHMLAKKSALPEDDEPFGCQVIKASSERRYTLGLAYGANLPDAGVALDGFRDFAGPDAVEQAAWSFLRKGARVGLHHQDDTEGHGTVVESYVYRGPDWEQPGGYVVKSGDWLLGVVWDEPTWDLIKSGRITGFSPQGAARRRQPSPQALADLRRA